MPTNVKRSDVRRAAMSRDKGRVRELRAELRRAEDAWEDALADLEEAGFLRRPIVPEHCIHNAHMYYLLLPDLASRSRFIDHLRGVGVHAVFHYVPLHDSVAGLRHGRSAGDLRVTEQVSDRLVRLPLWAGMSDGEVDRVVDATRSACAKAVQSPSAVFGLRNR